MRYDILIGENSHAVSLTNRPDGRFMTVDNGPATALSSQTLGNDGYHFQVGDLSIEAKVIVKGEDVFIEAFGRIFALKVLDPVEQAHATSQTDDLSVKAPMPGVVVEVHVSEGDAVEVNQPLLTIESMKLLTIICAAGAGRVATINHNSGEAFNKGAILVVVHSGEDENA